MIRVINLKNRKILLPWEIKVNEHFNINLIENLFRENKDLNLLYRTKYQKDLAENIKEYLDNLNKISIKQDFRNSNPCPWNILIDKPIFRYIKDKYSELEDILDKYGKINLIYQNPKDLPNMEFLKRYLEQNNLKEFIKREIEFILNDVDLICALTEVLKNPCNIEIEDLEDKDFLNPWDVVVSYKFKPYISYNLCKEWFYTQLREKTISEDICLFKRVLSEHGKLNIVYKGNTYNYAIIIKEYLENDSN